MERLIEEKSEKGYSFKIFWNYAFKEYHVVFYYMGTEIKYADLFGENRTDITKVANVKMLKMIIKDMEESA